jgi:perosamine synthetase
MTYTTSRVPNAPALDVSNAVEVLKEVLGPRSPVALHVPMFSGNEWTYVKECIDTGWVSSVGTFVDRFEKMLIEFTGAKYAIATVNGTAALHVCLLLAGVKPDDEVLLPALTFVATTNAVNYCHAVPHFVDSEESTLGLDPEKLSEYLADISVMRAGECFNKRTGRRIRAVVPMHTFGHPVDMDGLVPVCERFRLVMVEDAAESLGSYYRGQHTGNLGLVSSLSFNGNKTVTTGGGGAILTNDPTLGPLAKHLTTTARIPHKWSFKHDRVGYNYRMPNINAALGCAQLEQLPRFLSLKRALTSRYVEAFKPVLGVGVFQERADCRSNYWLNALVLDRDDIEARDRLLEMSNEKGIGTRPVWTLSHRLPMYSDCPAMDLGVAESLERRIINIPSSAELGTRYV